MDKTLIKDFFNKLAPSWGDGKIINDEIINIILDNAQVSEGKDILDVACGTGFLINYYLKRNVRFVTGVDLSDKMCEIASKRFDPEKVEIICEDIEEFSYDKKYDAIVIYNSFPHFIDGEKTICHLASMLKPNGILTVAHGMSRDRINNHHSNVSDELKCELPEADKLAEIFSKYLQVTTIISNEKMYQVAGRK